jgi:hypothetical protein
MVPWSRAHRLDRRESAEGRTDRALSRNLKPLPFSGGAFSVPSMIDSLEVKVLYPA